MFADGLQQMNTPNVGQPTKTYTHQLCVCIEYSLEERWMIGIDGERERDRERDREISTTWWW